MPINSVIHDRNAIPCDPRADRAPESAHTNTHTQKYCVVNICLISGNGDLSNVIPSMVANVNRMSAR